MSIFDKIGSLTERLLDRVGRDYGNCLSCGKPTRSHSVGGGVECHACHTSDEGVLVTDGGENFTQIADDPDATRQIRALADIPEFMGTDLEDYDLFEGDVADVPEMNAEVLIHQGLAEIVEDDDDDEELGDLGLEQFMGSGPGEGETNPDPHPTNTMSHQGNVSRQKSLIPTGQLNAQTHTERRVNAREYGRNPPSTDEVRDRLEDAIMRVMREEDKRVVESPTSSGKTHTVAGTRWGAREEITGGNQVVQLMPTRDARDDAANTAEEYGGDHLLLYSRDELCPVVAGEEDPEEDEDGNMEGGIVMDGIPASEWIEHVCNDKGVHFSVAHDYLNKHNDRGLDLPCTHDGDCPAIKQHEKRREGDHPLIIATHNFAHVPGLRHGRHVVMDEEPDFSVDLDTDRIRRAANAFLTEVGAPVRSWESFLRLADYDGFGDDAFREAEETEKAIRKTPDYEWFIEDEDAHTMIPAILRAVWTAEEQPSGRIRGKTYHEPPRLDAHANPDDEMWNREWVTVVLDQQNEVRNVRSVPDFNSCKSLVGLDAHPSMPLWQVNTWPDMQKLRILDPEERRLWREHERGLRIVQVGDATRPLGKSNYYDSRGITCLMEHLRDEYGEKFRTAITTKTVKNMLRQDMEIAGVERPELMHFGNTKSKNDFAGEEVGLVNGCQDPGDGYVLDLLAEVGADAMPEKADVCCEKCGDREEAPEEPGPGCPACAGTGMARQHGRGFTGEDAETAEAILNSVRQAETAQAAGRWARRADHSDDHATVFVRTDVLPSHMVDVVVPGVVWTFTDKQREVVDSLRESVEPKRALKVAEEAGVSKESVRRTFNRLAPDDPDDTPDGVGSRGYIHAFEKAGKHGATLYADNGMPNNGVADISLEEETATSHVWDNYTWSVAIRDPHDPPQHVDSTVETPQQGESLDEWSDAATEPGG